MPLPAPLAMSLVLSLDEQQSPVSFGGDDADLRGLVEKVGAGDVAAMATLFDVHAEMVERILARILGRGRDVDLADLLQDVFVRALEGIGRLSDPRLLRPWIAGIAVRTARETIRARARRKWLRFLPGHDVPEVATSRNGASPKEKSSGCVASRPRIPARRRRALPSRARRARQTRRSNPSRLAIRSLPTPRLQ